MHNLSCTFTDRSILVVMMLKLYSLSQSMKSDIYKTLLDDDESFLGFGTKYAYMCLMSW